MRRGLFAQSSSSQHWRSLFRHKFPSRLSIALPNGCDIAAKDLLLRAKYQWFQDRRQTRLKDFQALPWKHQIHGGVDVGTWTWSTDWWAGKEFQRWETSEEDDQEEMIKLLLINSHFSNTQKSLQLLLVSWTNNLMILHRNSHFTHMVKFEVASEIYMLFWVALVEN